MNRTVINLIMILVFVVCLGLIIYGQKNIGITGLLLELIGLIGLLTLLFIYNRRYK